MAKKILKVVKIQAPGGEATPAPPLGTVLGPLGIPIQDFVREFNEATGDQHGTIVPAEITVYEDRSFTFKLKTPPASDLLRRAAGVEKGSGEPHRNKVGTVTRAQVKEIAEAKMADLNAHDVEQAMKIVEGTARSMGINVEGK